MINWNTTYDEGHDFRPVLRQDIDAILKHAHIAPTSTALDIGCGTGQLTRELWHRGYKVIGIDISHVAINIAQRCTILDSDQLEYQVYDIENDTTPLPKAPFSLITCKLVYAFISDKGTFLKKMVTQLSDEGIFVIFTPLTDQVEPQRAHIAVDYHKTIDELSRSFTVIETIKQDHQVIFVCKKKV